MTAGSDRVFLEIRQDHLNITRIEKNGEVLLDRETEKESSVPSCTAG